MRRAVCVAAGVQLAVFEQRHSLSLRTFCSAGIWIVARGTVCFFVRFANWNILFVCEYTFEMGCECPAGSLCGCEVLSCAFKTCGFFGVVRVRAGAPC